jgi:hypothetical protein
MRVETIDNPVLGTIRYEYAETVQEVEEMMLSGDPCVAQGPLGIMVRVRSCSRRRLMQRLLEEPDMALSARQRDILERWPVVFRSNGTVAVTERSGSRGSYIHDPRTEEE